MFEPGSVSLSFLVFAIAVVVVVGFVATMVRYLMRRNTQATHH
jgi:hypothetical protein